MFRYTTIFVAAVLFVDQALAAASYPARFTLSINPAGKNASGAIEIKAGSGHVSGMKLSMPASRYSQIKGDGEIKIVGDRVSWAPPKTGGALRYVVLIDHKRSNGAFDAMINADWAIFRGDKVFPKAKVKAKGRALSELIITAPRGWHVNTGFDRTSSTQFRFDLTDPKRKFDAPRGWMIAGEIANRAEVIDGCKVVIAAPAGLGMRRQDTLALLNYTLPELRRAFGALPKQLLIVAGPDPMWRGGLSGPNSLFLHMDRPMISENGTSALLHELTHSITRLRAAERADWIAEGLAEFYGIEALRRSNGMTDARYQDTLSGLKIWSKGVKTLNVLRSSGETTARAVLLLSELDREIQAATGGKKNLDHITRALLASGGKVTLVQFKAEVQKTIGRASKTLVTPLLN
jgi:predicted metalloprotease with PDZ domain